MRSLPSGLQLKRSVTFTAKIRVSMPKVYDGDGEAAELSPIFGDGRAGQAAAVAG